MDEKILLSEKDIPQAWYNLQPDLPSHPKPKPPVNPQTKKPLDFKELESIFPKELIHKALEELKCLNP